MKTRRFVVLFVAVLTIGAVSKSVFAADLFAGKWKENISKSTYSPGPPPKNTETFTFEEVPNGLKYTSDYVTDNGQTGRDLEAYNPGKAGRPKKK